MRTIQPVASEPSMGTPHRHPLTDTTNRTIFNGAIPAAAAWSAAITAQGPTGIKEILVDILWEVNPTAAGDLTVDIHFSDNNTTTPAWTTAHPMASIKYTAASGTAIFRLNKELHIPVNTSNQFYVYCSAASNLEASLLQIVQKQYFC